MRRRAFLATPAMWAQDWASFLGPTHNAVSPETNVLREWPAGGPRMLWQFPKGTGYSSPAVVREHLVYMHRTGNRDRVECVHPVTGTPRWSFDWETQFEDRYGYNNGPRSSPVIDGDRVYTFSAEGKMHCLRLADGGVVWKRNLNADFKVPQDFFGAATTPLVEGSTVIVNVGAPGGPTVAALDKMTGRTVWGSGKDWGPSYASPVPATVHGKRRVFVFAGGESNPPSGGLIVLDPANGAIDFSFPWRSRSYESVNAASPVVFGNRVFVSASYRTGGVLLDLLPQGGYKVAWKSGEIGTHWNTAIHKDGYLYAFDGRNEPDAALVCVDVRDGKTVWREDIEGVFRGTLLMVDGLFVCLGERGDLLLLDLSVRGCRQLQRARLFEARETWSTPVLSRGLLYVSQHSRDFGSRVGPRLICYDLRHDGQTGRSGDRRDQNR